MIKNSQKGYVISLVTFFVLIITLTIALSMSSLIFYRQKISANSVASTQSYYAAEAGIEDALLRLRNNPQLSSVAYNMNINGASVNVNIPTVLGGSRAIASEAAKQSMVRKIQTVYGVDGYEVNFYYGIAVGEGGLQMGNSSRVKGNVFSSGNISGSGTIDNNVIVAGNGHSLQGVYVGGDALVYSCLSPASVNNLTYVVGGAHTCTVRGTTSVRSEEISDEPLPIPQTQIDAWKQEAADGNVINGNYSLSGSTRASLGPAKIIGNLTLSNSSVLTLTGVVYVTGNMVFQNTSQTKLSGSYGSTGGVIIADGTITTQNSASFSGSGQDGSYLMLLSTSASDYAIRVQNSAIGAVFYTSAGAINIQNSASVLEATGYKVIMGNSCTIEYSTGIENIYFSNGPGGSWKVMSWQEE